MSGRAQLVSQLSRWIILAGLVFTLSGCFQPAGSDVQPTRSDLTDLTRVATEIPPTPTLFITPIPATNLPPTLTPMPDLPTATPTNVPPMPTDIPVNPSPVPPTPTLTPDIPATPTALNQTNVVTATETPALLPTPTALPTDSPCLHTVQPGEWLYAIARKYNISAQDLIAANPRYANGNLQPGDVLRIPNCTNTPVAPAIATTAAQPAPTTQPQVGPTATLQANAPTPIPVIDRVYIVAAGDTLGAIARKFNTTVAALKAANGIKDGDFLRIGQRLRIPEPTQGGN